MSAHGQKVLISHLVERESLETLAREGLDLECVPTEELRPVVTFALDYYFQSGQSRAPSPDVFLTEFGDLLTDFEVSLGEPEDSIEWAIDDLKGTFVHKESQRFNKAMATAVAGAATQDKIEALSEAATELVHLLTRLEPHTSARDVREAIEGRLQAYEARAAHQGEFQGMRLGFDPIDHHTFGIHDGELAILAAGAKTGKSYFVNRTALKEHQAGRSVMLFTLENSVDMTIDRIACLACGIDPTLWERGLCSEADLEIVRQWEQVLLDNTVPFIVRQPPMGQRTVEYMTRQAQLEGVDSLIIDQLTFVEHPDPGRKQRWEIIRELMHDLKTAISTARRPIPCLVAHQIKREGIATARKIGFHRMDDLAEGSEAERTADAVFSLYQSDEARAAGMMLFQVLAGRRFPLKAWDLDWDLSAGMFRVRSERQLEAA